MHRTTHGHAYRGRETPEYKVWSDMKSRCSNPGHRAYPRYGGRGIAVCDRWQTFESFLEDMGPRPSPNHSIDRIDNDGEYSPENCRWATPSEQNRNYSRNRLLTLEGETRCVTEWAEALGISKRSILSRLRRGWSAEKALTTPVR